MQTLRETDAHFAERGATHYTDTHYPSRYSYQSGQYTEPGGLFSRHYFRDGVEIGYVLPDFLRFDGHGIHYFHTPRVWGIPHTLHTLCKNPASVGVPSGTV